MKFIYVGVMEWNEKIAKITEEKEFVKIALLDNFDGFETPVLFVLACEREKVGEIVETLRNNGGKPILWYVIDFML